MTPLHNRILAEVIPEEPTKSGLINMDTMMKVYSAKVLAVGPKVKYCKVGDIVRYDHNEVESYDLNGAKCIWGREGSSVTLVL